jgi:phosphoglycolate phosphatase-like HAD superfamily hydrolase
MFDLSKYDYLIFDCDGVIFNSNYLKSKAFADALPSEPYELVNSFVDYHQKHGGISRYEKFRYYFREMKKSPDVEKESRNAIIRFATIVKKGLIECDYVPGVLEFVKEANSLGIPLFVVSGSDEKELIDVFRQRGILNLFEKTYGSPVNKEDNTAKVVKKISDRSRGCFFGDSKSDYVAASKYGLDFVFVSGLSEWEENNKSNHSNETIKNFLEICTTLQYAM